MDLLDLLSAMKDLVGHGYVRWDSKDGEIRIYTGLTMRDENGIVESHKPLRQTSDTIEFTEMGH